MQNNSGCCREDCSKLLPLPEALDRSFGLRCDVLLAFSVETSLWQGAALAESDAGGSTRAHSGRLFGGVVG